MRKNQRTKKEIKVSPRKKKSRRQVMDTAVEKFLSHDWDEFTDKFDDVQTCNHTMDGTKAILKDMGYIEAEVDDICEWFEHNGGYCDCEVFLNVVMGNDPRGLD